MKLVSFSTSDGKVRPGSLLEDGSLVVDLTSAGYTDTLAVISAGFDGRSRRQPSPAYPISDVSLHAPISNPPRVFAIGLNYRDHAKESGMAIPTTPVVFFKLTTAIIGPGEPLCCRRTRPSPTTRPSSLSSLARAAIESLPRRGASTSTDTRS